MPSQLSWQSMRLVSVRSRVRTSLGARLRINFLVIIFSSREFCQVHDKMTPACNTRGPELSLWLEQVVRHQYYGNIGACRGSDKNLISSRRITRRGDIQPLDKVKIGTWFPKTIINRAVRQPQRGLDLMAYNFLDSVIMYVSKCLAHAAIKIMLSAYFRISISIGVCVVPTQAVTYPITLVAKWVTYQICDSVVVDYKVSEACNFRQHYAKCADAHYIKAFYNYNKTKLAECRSCRELNPDLGIQSPQ